ncbi:hypothetical protein [Methylobacterium sp. CM6257]
MAKLAVITTVEGVLSAWADCPPRMPVNEDGETDGTGDLFILVQYPVANSSRTTHSLSFVEEGAARIVIHEARGAGLEDSIKVGEDIGALFRAKKINGIEFKVPTSPLVHDDNDDGMYFKTSVVIPYVYHFDGNED